MLVRSPTAAAARTRRDASPGDSRSTLINTRIMRRLGQRVRQIPRLSITDQGMIDQRNPIPPLLEVLHQPINRS